MEEKKKKGIWQGTKKGNKEKIFFQWWFWRENLADIDLNWSQGLKKEVWSTERLTEGDRWSENREKQPANEGFGWAFEVWGLSPYKK